MRLIDLDQTIFVPIVDESKGGVEYEVGMTVAEFFEKFFNGFQPLVVDAIPVEWLEQTQHNSTDAQWHYAVAVVLAMWKKEQEADGT